jgi:three-Cys-motif partner protein
MGEKAYEWANGVTFEKHSRRRHRILREYFTQYLRVRLGHPQQTKFRFSSVDWFSEAGKYKCGSRGSPLIFVEVLRTTLNEVNIQRAAEGLALVEIECLLVLNDGEREAVELLRQNMAPVLALARQECRLIDFCTACPFSRSPMVVFEVIGRLRQPFVRAFIIAAERK